MPTPRRWIQVMMTSFEGEWMNTYGNKVSVRNRTATIENEDENEIEYALQVRGTEIYFGEWKLVQAGSTNTSKKWTFGRRKVSWYRDADRKLQEHDLQKKSQSPPRNSRKRKVTSITRSGSRRPLGFLEGNWTNDSGESVVVKKEAVTISNRSKKETLCTLRCDDKNNVFLGKWKLCERTEFWLKWSSGLCFIKWYRSKTGQKSKKRKTSKLTKSQPTQREVGIAKKSKKQISRETQELRSMVEFNQILHFICLFKDKLRLPNFTPQDLELALIISHDNDFMDLVMRSLLFLLPEVKQPLGPHQWEGRLRRICAKRFFQITDYDLCLGDDHETFLDLKMGEKIEFHQYSAKLKTVLLANICDWVAESPRISAAAERLSSDQRTPQSLPAVAKNASQPKTLKRNSFSRFNQKVIPSLKFKEGTHVGRKLAMYWDGDNIFYKGKLITYKTSGKYKGKYMILYDDDNFKEHICIEQEVIQWLS